MEVIYEQNGVSRSAESCAFARDAPGLTRESTHLESLCSSQTLAATVGCNQSQGPMGFDLQSASSLLSLFDEESNLFVLATDVGPAEPRYDTASWLKGSVNEQRVSAAYTAFIEMIRNHKTWESTLIERTQLDRTSGVDDGSRMILISWLVEVAEEFALQQETLHSAVVLLDRFLSTSQGVPRCVLQLVAVGCVFIAAKQLEVQHPSVSQLVAVAAHSFTASDLLRVERILLDALDFSVTSPTAYNFLHLLTQATLAANDCSSSSLLQQAAAATGTASAAASPDAITTAPMEVVVSLAMYLIELALLDRSSLAIPCSKLATAALMLAYAKLDGSCRAWPTVLSAAGFTEAEVAPIVPALGRLHIAACHPSTAQLEELLMPMKVKFGQDCWCKVSTDVAAYMQP